MATILPAKFLFCDTTTGLPSYIAHPTASTIYVDKTIYHTNIAIKLPDTVESDSEILSTYHWDGVTLGKHLPNTIPHYIWDTTTFSYIEPPDYLLIVQKENIAEINSLAGEKILAKYPIWKQNNLLARSIELQSQGLVGNVEWLEIQAIWDWVKLVRTESNTAVLAVQNATDVATMQLVVQNFITLLGTL